MSRTFNLWALAQAELLYLAGKAHDFLAAHGLGSGSEQQRLTPDGSDPLPGAHADLAAAANMACPAEPPALPPPHDFSAC
ncbi:MAG: hypothetical protein BWY52_02846 [Chloroflexi bacterium ADurb.Bin325]|nr:MAG: hypothetical protein BWY52_02846 [Chloroflexi bacterium ADurb.Bin325]